MISLVAGKYRDMVFMTPISRMNSDIIIKYFWIFVQEFSETGFYVVATTADNNSPNRTTFFELLGGNWR